MCVYAGQTKCSLAQPRAIGDSPYSPPCSRIVPPTNLSLASQWDQQPCFHGTNNLLNILMGRTETRICFCIQLRDTGSCPWSTRWLLKLEVTKRPILQI